MTQAAAQAAGMLGRMYWRGDFVQQGNFTLQLLTSIIIQSLYRFYKFCVLNFNVR